MANVNEVMIKGFVPFDPGSSALEWLGRMVIPSYGLKITFDHCSWRPSTPNEHGGYRTYYSFTIEGQEALWTKTATIICKDLKEGGCILTKAKIQGVEEFFPWIDIPEGISNMSDEPILVSYHFGHIFQR